MTNLLGPERSLKIGAFLAIYLIWGSTYLAIRLLAETLPGLTMMGMRFFVAGAALYLWARWRGAARPTRRNWSAGAVTGGLMLCGGTGFVIVAMRQLDSGMVALLVGMVPLWIAFLMWLWPGIRQAGGQAPSWATVGALLVGFVGVAILAAPGNVLGSSSIHLQSVLVTMAACVLWGLGSIYSRNAELPSSPHLVSALQMLSGGAMIVTWGLLDGEWASFEPQAVSSTSVLAFFYLVVFGSIVAFSAYSWLIRNTEPTLVATYAYVNPVVAIFLGWWIADEPLSARTLLAAALILGSVVLVTTENARRKRRTAKNGNGEIDGTIHRKDAPRGTAAVMHEAASQEPLRDPALRQGDAASYDAVADRSLEKCA